MYKAAFPWSASSPSGRIEPLVTTLSSQSQTKKYSLHEGISLYNEGKIKEALDFFLSVTGSGKTSGEISDYMAGELNYYIGLCCAALKKYDDALAFLEQVVTGGTREVTKKEETERILQCRLILAVIYTLTGRYGAAESEMQKLLDAGYKEDNVYCTAAFLSWEEQDAQKSISYYERALEINAQNVTALNGLGYVLCLTGRDLTRALDCASKAVEMKRCAATLDSLGLVYLKLGMTNKGKECLNRALEMAEDEEQLKIIQEHISRE